MANVRVLLSVLSLAGLMAVGVVAIDSGHAQSLARQARTRLSMPVLVRRSPTPAPQPATLAALALGPQQPVPSGALFLYPQRGYPDGHGDVARSDRVYEVYRLPNGDYWLRVADAGGGSR